MYDISKKFVFEIVFLIIIWVWVMEFLLMYGEFLVISNVRIFLEEEKLNWILLDIVLN